MFASTNHLRLAAATRPIRMLTNSRQHFHSSSTRQGSPLFALASLSNARETQHLAKLSRLSRVEHSPSLKLIQSSEVDPFDAPSSSKPVPRPAHGKSVSDAEAKKAVNNTKVSKSNVTDGYHGAQSAKVDFFADASDSDAQNIGKAVLEELSRLRSVLSYEQHRYLKLENAFTRFRIQQEHSAFILERRSARKGWILGLTVLGFMSYLIWQPTVGDELAAASASNHIGDDTVQPPPAAAKEDHTVFATTEQPQVRVDEPIIEPPKSTSWKGIFWKL